MGNLYIVSFKQAQICMWIFWKKNRVTPYLRLDGNGISIRDVCHCRFCQYPFEERSKTKVEKLTWLVYARSIQWSNQRRFVLYNGILSTTTLNTHHIPIDFWYHFTITVRLFHCPLSWTDLFLFLFSFLMEVLVNQTWQLDQLVSDS